MKLGAKGWLGVVMFVARILHLPLPTTLTFQYELEEARSAALSMDRATRYKDAMTTSKLCTYVKIKDFEAVSK